ncbi:MAG TPA: IS110 family transposase [Thermodesulfobacteriota bacterium]|nr:IS110 family transposase [Thermodesulfobacteriota bacterium]
MKGEVQDKKVLIRGKEVFIGVDVHKESWHVTARTEGEEVFHGGIPSQYHAFQRLFDHFKDCKVKVAYEAGPCGFWLYDRLTEDGIETIVVPPSLIPIESGNRVKTDKRDSRKLAKLLEGNLLKRVYVLREEDREDRELLRTRRQIVEHRNDVARQIKSKLLFYGIRSPFSAKERWTKQYLRWVKGLLFEREVLKVSFQSLMELYEYLSVQLVKMNKKVIELSQNEKYLDKVRLLRSVPGIGILIAMEILVELPEMERFKSGDELASYIGLTPSEYSTGQYVRQGRITRCGNKRVRTCAVEGSWILITKDPLMRLRYKKLKAMKGAKRAIIAIARRMMIQVRRILLSREPYRVGAPGVIRQQFVVSRA